MSDDTQATLPVDDGPLTAPPFLVDRYEVGALIGRGGVGQVHRAIDHRTQEAVAIKFVRTTRHFALRQVRRELTALRALALPGVVRLLDDGMFNGQYFLVMSLVTGQRLDEAMAGLSWEHGAPMVRSLLATLGRVHLAGVVHRDLKPANIRVNEQGRPVLIDFGLAWGKTVARVGGTTREGSLGFAAPEQWRGEAGDARTDLYACGRILRDWVATCGAPEALGEMVARMLARDPDDRPRSALEVLEAFGGDRDAVRGRIPPLPDPAPALALRTVFGGPLRSFFHLDEDAAALLFAQSEGVRDRVEQTLAGWVDRGDARWNGQHFTMDRPTLDRLTLAHDAPQGVLPDPERARERAISARSAGRLSQAWALLEPATLWVREDQEAEATVLTELVVLALELEHLPAIEAALHLCERSELLDFLRGDCVHLLQGARAAICGEGDRARRLLDPLHFEAPALQRMRNGYRTVAAASQSLDEHQALLEALDREGAARPDYAGWLGTLAYRQGSWHEAAALHEEAMRDRALPHLRLASQINAAQTWLEALDFERARDHAAQAVDAAYALRHADFQARATWVLRTAAYRQDTATEPQPDLVAAAFAVGTRRGALHAMTEAAIAWRIGHPSAVALAEQARTGFHASGVSAGALLARSLHAAASADPAAVSPDIRQEVLAIGVPEICLQAAALWPGLTLDRQTALDLARDRPEAEWSVRLDVLSIDEALCRLGAID